ncbi:MAG: HAD-IA family hydrolase [Acidimicrobiia bacterium]
MRDRYEAVIFDMDGVVTGTAPVHRRAWAQLFDEYLAGRDQEARPFSGEDYLDHVDGRLRIDGVTTFLASRGVRLPLGQPSDPPSSDTAWGLANRKNELFVASVHADGVDVFPSTLALLRRLRAIGVRTALVTASRNADLVLAAAGASGLFDAQVDGTDAEELGLAGKPDPASFVEAARRLGVSPGATAVVEDARAGVAAAGAGRFGLVVGVDRAGHPDALRAAGADIVVGDLADLPDEALVGPSDPWVLAYRGFDPDTEGTREALLTLGNGYVATRGAMTHVAADGVHYPGTYAAGVFNRLTSRVEGRDRVDESVVNLPNWLPLTFRAADGDWLSASTGSLRAHRVAIDLRTGMLTRDLTVVDPAGRRTRLHERRLVSMDDPHLAAVEWRLTPENWSGPLAVRSAVDARVGNDNVTAHRALAGRHLTVEDTGRHGPVSYLVTTTTTSKVRVAVAIRTATVGGRQVGTTRGVDTDGLVGHELRFEGEEGGEIGIEKIAVIATSRDHAIAEPALAAVDAATRAGGFDELAAAHRRRWAELWEQFRLELDNGDDMARAVRVQALHVLQTLSPNTVDLDVGVPARGLHGEGYRGHVFWDELFVFPVLDLRLPELTRSLQLYRWRRLPAARRLAGDDGMPGARFPWQSGSDGREETPRSLFNPRSGRWMPDHSRRQCHVNVAVAYNVWQHWQITADLGYLERHGAELLIESARYLAARTDHDTGDDRYDLRSVMGPDEFHDGYPDLPGGGVDNNAYLNVMTAWALARARDAYDLLQPLGTGLAERLGIDARELDRWDRVSRRLRVPFLGNGLLAQFDGYEDLEELDWAAYRDRYGNIGRLDLILEAEGDTTNRYQASKQADVLMLFYLLDADELTAVLERLGYPFDPATIPATVAHYLARTSHGSTLSRIVHAWVLARTDRAHSWELLREALHADLDDTQGGTTREGIHLGAMAGSLDILQRCYPGLDARGDVLWLNPVLPEELRSLELGIRYRGQRLEVRVDHDELVLAAEPGPAAPVSVGVAHVGGPVELHAAETLRFELPPQTPVRPPDRSAP